MRTLAALLIIVPLVVGDGLAQAGTDRTDASQTPPHLRDRGTGVPTSMFGTFISQGELLIYPSFEYYHDNDAEYSPLELGYDLDEDYRGRYRAYEGLIFIGYGLSDALCLEVEAAVIEATLETSAEDPSETPSEITESGLGDVQMQVNWAWMKETSSRPELFSFGEIVFPLQKDKVLIGTSDWEFKVGAGLNRGFSWGTLTLRAAVEHDRAEDVTELGEVAVEYLKRLSPTWRVYLGVEGAQDEIELISELQWHLHRRAFVKFNSAFGLTSKATDWAPEIGVMFRL